MNNIFFVFFIYKHFYQCKILNLFFTFSSVINLIFIINII
jgi:hypothetical protein